MIQIDEMILRVPGISAEEGTGLGAQIASKLSDRMGDDSRSGQIESLKISMPSGNGNQEDLADAIAEQIFSQLKLAVH